MKDNQLLTALSEISPDLLEETKEPVPKKNGKLWLRIGAAAAAFLIAGAVWLRLSPFRENSVLTPTENDSSAVSSGAETETPATASDEVSGQEDGTTGEPVTEEPIRWTEEPGSYLEKESGENLVSLGSNVVLSESLLEQIHQAGPTDRIAFAVWFLVDSSHVPEEYPSEIQEASRAHMEAENRIGTLYNYGQVEEWVSTGMGWPEAWARILQTDAYREAKLEALRTKAEFARLYLRYWYTLYSKQDARLLSCGLEKLYDVNGEKGLAYFDLTGCKAVYCGTRQQILSLEDAFSDQTCHLILRGVPEDAAALAFADYYLTSDCTLPDGEKLTEELKATFERQETVLCRVYWNNLWGELETMDKREREEMAARSIGLSGMAELEASDDLELHQQFLEALRNLNSHSDELEELAGSLFRNGELEETKEYGGYFLASLSAERAAEVAGAPEVGFLHVGITSSTVEPVIGD